jgi:hypothetical protein
LLLLLKARVWRRKKIKILSDNVNVNVFGRIRLRERDAEMLVILCGLNRWNLTVVIHARGNNGCDQLKEFLQV